jgi:hypothetical protein
MNGDLGGHNVEFINLVLNMKGESCFSVWVFNVIFGKTRSKNCSYYVIINVRFSIQMHFFGFFIHYAWWRNYNHVIIWQEFSNISAFKVS